MPNRLFKFFNRRRAGGQVDMASLLQTAHAQMQGGQYLAAAEAFDTLARRAFLQNGPRASLFALQSGRAYLLANNLPEAMAHFTQGLTTMVKEKQFGRLGKVGLRIVEELKARGHIKEAREINNLVISNMPARADLPTEHGPDPARVIAPVTCPSCGGPVRSDEVDWIDSHTAECPYCGTPLRFS
jgi:hypothetical protein